MFNEAQLAIIKRAMIALTEREMHMNNVVSDDVQALIDSMNEPVEAPKAKKAKVVEEPVVAEEPKAE